MTLTIAPIGSCRIFDPLRRARERHGFKMLRGRSMGFTHTSPEAVQQLGVMQRELDIPEDLWDYVASQPRDEVLAQDHIKADRYVVELCSEKILNLGDTFLQINYFTTQFKDFFKDKTRKNAYWRAIERGTDDDVDQFLAETWSGSARKDAERQILRQVRMRRADEMQTRADIRVLKAALGDVLFVTHVNAIGTDGTQIKTRNRYIEMVEKIAAEEGCPVYNPTCSMLEVGQATSMEADLDHYTDAFKDRVVDDWFARFFTA